MLRTLSFKATKRRNTVGILTLLQILHKFSFLLMIVIRVLNGSLSTDCDITIGSRCTVIVLGEKCCTSELLSHAFSTPPYHPNTVFSEQYKQYIN